MARIVLHIGPEKCGSTSIQKSLALGSASYHSLLLNPYLLIELDHANPDPNVIRAIEAEVSDRMSSSPEKTLVVSHEMIFKSEHMLTWMTRICTELVSDVRAVLYTRRQSDFAVSGFGQWHFRSPDRLSEARRILEQNNVDPILFLGVERHLLAGLLGGWTIFRQPSGHLYLNWRHSTADCQAILDRFDVPMSVGVLPRPGFGFDLFADFLTRAGLPVSDHGVHKNVSFAPAVIEATVRAIDAGMTLPGPHDANDFYTNAHVHIVPDPENTRFLNAVKGSIDAAFWEDNQIFAQTHDLSTSYFAPNAGQSTGCLLDLIAVETNRRNEIGREKMLNDALEKARFIYDLWQAHQEARQSG